MFPNCISLSSAVHVLLWPEWYVQHRDSYISEFSIFSFLPPLPPFLVYCLKQVPGKFTISKPRWNFEKHSLKL